MAVDQGRDQAVPVAYAKQVAALQKGHACKVWLVSSSDTGGRSLYRFLADLCLYLCFKLAGADKWQIQFSPASPARVQDDTRSLLCIPAGSQQCMCMTVMA